MAPAMTVPESAALPPAAAGNHQEESDMPSRVRVSEFVSYVQAGKYVEAISDFYAETAPEGESWRAQTGGL